MRTSKHVQALVERAFRLPHEIPDFKRGEQLLRPGTSSGRAERLLGFFAPVLDKVNFQGSDSMSPRHAKRFEHTAKVAACYTMATHLRDGYAALKAEATTAGVDLPTFTRQLLLTITRAYAQLFTLQLFGVLPLNGPTGRLHFKDFQYDSSFTGSTPYIDPGDRTDQKFNPSFFEAPEGAQANKYKLTWSNLDVGVTDHRVVAEWTDQLTDDSRAVYDDDAESSLMNHIAQEHARMVDRKMILALIASVPAGNSHAWDATPSANPDYGTLTPSEQDKWDGRLFTDGINGTIAKIRAARKFNNDGEPEWAIVGTTFAQRLLKVSGFKAVEKSSKEIDVRRGAVRDLGELDSVGVRFLVDPGLGDVVAGGDDHCYFGRKPAARGDAALYWAPYIALQPTRDLYDPDTGTTTKGVRSRFGIVRPNTQVNPASSQLADVYGKLAVAA